MADLENMSDAELAKYQGNWKQETHQYVSAMQEWDRRKMKMQHDYDVKLIKEQVKWMKFAALIGVLATLVGAILGAYLSKI